MPVVEAFCQKSNIPHYAADLTNNILPTTNPNRDINPNRKP